MTSEDALPTFRAGVGAAVIGETGLVLAFERRDVPGAWQLPQGGLERNECAETAAWRELEEETGIGPQHVSLKRASDFWVGYELPEPLRSPKTGRGQVHKWFCFTLPKGMGLPPLPSGEFVNRKWTTLSALSAETARFRRPEYAIVEAWLADVT